MDIILLSFWNTVNFAICIFLFYLMMFHLVFFVLESRTLTLAEVNKACSALVVVLFHYTFCLCWNKNPRYDSLESHCFITISQLDINDFVSHFIFNLDLLAYFMLSDHVVLFK